jgi:hypothetical protein
MEWFNRLRRCDQIVAISAILLFVFVFFFKWYGVSTTSSVGGVSFSASASGWQAFTNSRWIWLITIIVALAAVVIASGAWRPQRPIPLGAIVTGLGALSTLVIFFRIVHHPTAGTSGSIEGVQFSATAGIKIGIWLGLLAAIGITYGGYLTMQQEGGLQSVAGGPAGDQPAERGNAAQDSPDDLAGAPAAAEPAAGEAVAQPIPPPAEPPAAGGPPPG